MTATEWFTIMVIVAAVELLWLAGETLVDAFLRELHADDLRRIAADTTTYLRGSAAGGCSVETLSTPGRPTPLRPGVGITLQASDSRLDRDSVDLPCDESQTRTADVSRDSAGTSREAAGTVTDRGGPGPQQPVGGRVPRPQSPTGPQPHPQGEVPARPAPELVAPTIGSAT